LAPLKREDAAPAWKNYTDAFEVASGRASRTSIVERIMGDIVVVMLGVAAAAGVIALAAGILTRSRALTMLGASLLASVALSWVLGLLGLPVGIVFGFLGTGAFFRTQRDRSSDAND